MPRPIRVVDILIVVVKAILITAAILYFGRFFGLRVPKILTTSFPEILATCR